MGSSVQSLCSDAWGQEKGNSSTALLYFSFFYKGDCTYHCSQLVCVPVVTPGSRGKEGAAPGQEGCRAQAHPKGGAAWLTEKQPVLFLFSCSGISLLLLWGAARAVTPHMSNPCSAVNKSCLNPTPQLGVDLPSHTFEKRPLSLLVSSWHHGGINQHPLKTPSPSTPSECWRHHNIRRHRVGDKNKIHKILLWFLHRASRSLFL